MKIVTNNVITGVVLSFGQSVGKDRIFPLNRNQVVDQNPFLYILAHGFHSFYVTFLVEKRKFSSSGDIF